MTSTEESSSNKRPKLSEEEKESNNTEEETTTKMVMSDKEEEDSVTFNSDYEEEDDEYSYVYSDNEDDEVEEESNKMMTNESSSSSSSEAASSSLAVVASGNSSNNNNNKNNNGGERILFQTNTRPTSFYNMVDLKPELNDLVSEVVSALDVPKPAALPLLRLFKYDLQSLLQEYFVCNEPQQLLSKAGVMARCNNVCIDSGLSVTPNTINETVAVEEDDCMICMDTMTSSNSLAMGCGHKFCLDCWQDYLVNAIEYEGMTCITTTCPLASCNELVSELEIQTAAPLCLSKYQHYQLRNFVESSPKMTYCPGIGCDNRVCVLNKNHLTTATSSLSLSSAGGMAENCLCCQCTFCSTEFCFGCGDEPHLPVSCKNVSNWQDKNTNESETANWITANTKPCPKCSTRINKDGGCMYMKCRNCNHGFCWMCMGTHHVHSCNAYTGDESDNVQKAKNDIERYLHYFQRFHGHDKGQEFVMKQLSKLLKQQLEEDLSSEHKKDDDDDTKSSAVVVVSKSSSRGSNSSDINNNNNNGKSDDDNNEKNARLKDDNPQQPSDTSSSSSSSSNTTENYYYVDVVELLIKANQQLLECRRVLKYSYVFAFYHFQDVVDTTVTTTIPTSKPTKQQKECFEYHQGILERHTEILSEITEQSRNKIRPQQVHNQTAVVKQFIKKFLEYLNDDENDDDDNNGNGGISMMMA